MLVVRRPAHRPAHRLVCGVAALAALAFVVAACSDGDALPAPSPTVASPSPSPSPTPSPTPTGPTAILTGEVVTDADMLRPALIVKIENTKKARPQAGLEVADLVFEELVEGGITRFFAVFQSQVPTPVGPIRSARLVDADLLPAFDGILLFSGGRPEVESAVRGVARLMTEGDPGVYRESGRRRPSNLFADGQAVLDEAISRQPDLGPPTGGFVFDTEPPAGACATCDGASFDISMSSQTTAGWTYDAAAGVYRRANNGAPQETVSGVAVGAANVVALGVELTDGGCCDTAGSPYVNTRTTGTGRAVVLRDGRWYEAEWTRPAASSPLRLTVAGVDLPLRPGKTWLHLVPASRLQSPPAA